MMQIDDLTPSPLDTPSGAPAPILDTASEARCAPVDTAPKEGSDATPAPTPKTKRKRVQKAATQPDPIAVDRIAPPAVPNSQLTDALDVLGGSTARSIPSAPLSVFVVDGNEKLFVPFTTRSATASVHYLDGPTFRGYARCSGAGCIPCCLGRRADQRLLLPVFDPVGHRIAVLPIPTAIRPGALGPQIRPLLARVHSGEVFVVGVRRSSDYTMTVTEYAAPNDADLDLELVAAFARELEAGRVTLASVYPIMTAGDIASIPELANEARLRGVKL